MKKQLLNLSLIASAIMLFASTAFSQPVAPVKVVDCPAVTEVPVIDGLADEAHWSPDQTLTIFSLSNAADWTGEADFGITFKMAWSYGYFYTLVTMTDDVDHSWDGTNGNPWEFDNVEWFFQLDTQTAPTDYTDNTIQMRFNRGSNGDPGWVSCTYRNGVVNTDEIPTYWENTADGWLVECAIPWTCMMPDGSLPDDIMDYIADGLIGFDLSGADSDGTDPLVGDRANGTQTGWDEDGTEGDTADGTEDNAWNNTSVFGYLNMVGTPIASTQEVAAEGTFSVYPNPATNTINITGANGPVELYSVTGVHVMTIETNIADVSSLTSGVYIAVFDNQSVKILID
jgi:hypothetical protein